jgi:hypothetical protein
MIKPPSGKVDVRPNFARLPAKKEDAMGVRSSCIQFEMKENVIKPDQEKGDAERR